MTTLDEARAVAQRLRGYALPNSSWQLPKDAAHTIDALVAEVERLTKVDVEPVAYMTSDGFVVEARGKTVRLLNTPGDQTSGYRIYDPFPKHTIPLVPASTLAALQAENERLEKELSATNEYLWATEDDLISLRHQLDDEKSTITPDVKTVLQAITDPENQPSQYDTVTLSMYDALRAENERLREALELCIAFIEDASIEEAQWHWKPIDAARAALEGTK